MKEYIDNLNKILQYKEDIKQSIISKGQTVGDSLCEYSFAIDNIITPPVIPDILDTDPLTFVRLDNDGDGWISIEQHGNIPNKHFLYKLNDDDEWTIYRIGTVVRLNQGDKIQFRSYDNSPMGIGSVSYYNFTTLGIYKCGGRLSSLSNDTLDTLSSFCFVYLFNNCNITTAPALPWTTLSEYCYYNMFLNCNLLRNAPELPATILANGCYNYMFDGCCSITNAPELPATTLADYCYYGMFRNCDKLSHAMVELPAIELKENCYGIMFYNCKSLQRTPLLPSEYIKKGCYDYMFYGCNRLKDVRSQARYIVDDSGYVEITNEIGKQWLAGVRTNGNFYKNPEWSGPTERNADTIPPEWVVVNLI